MARYAALLRGIAPSGRNMTNDKLRGVLERMGLREVGSVLSSGNLVLTADDDEDPADLERRIEDALARDLDLANRVIVRSAGELRALVDTDPFHGLVHGETSYLVATFVKDPASAPAVVPDPPDPRSRVIRYDRAARAVLAVADNTPGGGGGPYMAWLERTFGTDVTTRSWLSVQRVLRRLEG